MLDVRFVVCTDGVPSFSWIVCCCTLLTAFLESLDFEVFILGGIIMSKWWISLCVFVGFNIGFNIGCFVGFKLSVEV